MGIHAEKCARAYQDAEGVHFQKGFELEGKIGVRSRES